MQGQEMEYAGFWVRTGATLIDAILLILISYPLLIAIYGLAYFNQTELYAGTADFFISTALPILATILFWKHKQATPGEMAISAKIVDATTGQQASTSQLVIRYLGYLVATLPLGLGIIWVAFDKRKQGFHDKMASTVVIKQVNTGPEPVQFKNY